MIEKLTSNSEELFNLIKASATRSQLNEKEGFILICIKLNPENHDIFSEKIISSLNDKGLIKIENSITLTTKGEIVAKSILSALQY